MYILIRREMSQTIEQIDATLNKLDALLATLPLDYQQDYAQEIMGRFE